MQNRIFCKLHLVKTVIKWEKAVVHPIRGRGESGGVKIPSRLEITRASIMERGVIFGIYGN